MKTETETFIQSTSAELIKGWRRCFGTAWDHSFTTKLSDDVAVRDRHWRIFIVKTPAGNRETILAPSAAALEYRYGMAAFPPVKKEVTEVDDIVSVHWSGGDKNKDFGFRIDFVLKDGDVIEHAYTSM